MENADKVIELLQKQIQKLNEIGNDLTQWEANTNSILRRAFNDPNIDVYDSRGESLSGDNSYAKEQLRYLLEGYIDQIKGLGLPKTIEKNTIANHINISNTININFIIDILRDDLNGKQINDLKSANDRGKDTEEKKKNILKAIKNFGSDVASNILASILTNSNILNGL